MRLERRSNLSWKGKGVHGKELRDFRTPPGLDWNKQRKEKQKQKTERKQQRLPEVKEAPNSCPQRKVKTQDKKLEHLKVSWFSHLQLLL